MKELFLMVELFQRDNKKQRRVANRKIVQIGAFQREEENRLIELGSWFGAAGGGIAKLAGVDSGKPPESGPTPQGLGFFIKKCVDK